jgi:hypothetical protein
MDIPNTWNTLEEFTDWYIKNGYPRKPPDPPEVYFTDVGTSIIIFRHDVYQAEFYIGGANFLTERHYHPFEQRIMSVGGTGRGRSGRDIVKDEPDWIMTDTFKKPNSTLYPDQWHQLQSFNKGLYFFNFQKWPSVELMTSAIIEYGGKSLGPVHDKLLENINPKLA